MRIRPSNASQRVVQPVHPAIITALSPSPPPRRPPTGHYHQLSLLSPRHRTPATKQNKNKPDRPESHKSHHPPPPYPPPRLPPGSPRAGYRQTESLLDSPNRKPNIRVERGPKGRGAQQRMRTPAHGSLKSKYGAPKRQERRFPGLQRRNRVRYGPAGPAFSTFANITRGPATRRSDSSVTSLPAERQSTCVPSSAM